MPKFAKAERLSAFAIAASQSANAAQFPSICGLAIHEPLANGFFQRFNRALSV